MIPIPERKILSAADLSDVGDDFVALYRYWASLKSETGLPNWRQFDPLETPKHLPLIWVVEVHFDPVRLRHRLIGTSIVDSYDEDLTGKWFDDAWIDLKSIPVYNERYAEAVRAGIPSFRRGEPRLKKNRDWSMIENLLLPFDFTDEFKIVMGYTHIYDSKGARTY